MRKIVEVRCSVIVQPETARLPWNATLWVLKSRRMQTRVLIRTAFIIVLTAIAVLWNGADILLPWHPFSTYGFSADPRGNVTAV